jgi:putative transposase
MLMVLIVLMCCFASLYDAIHCLPYLQIPHRARQRFYRRQKRHRDDGVCHDGGMLKAPHRKPAWVSEAVIQLASRTPAAVCSYRFIQQRFNRLYRTYHITVGKDYVGAVLKQHARRIQRQRHDWRASASPQMQVNHLWAIDITSLTNTSLPVLGVIDCGSRRLLCLQTLPRKTACAIARMLIDVIERYGIPRCLRSDNEAMFTSHALRYVLQWFGIHHQRSEPRCPWQNGKIERFLGTLKRELTHLVPAKLCLAQQLNMFAHYYNHHRSHQALNNKTPMDAWWRGKQMQRCDSS